jgi:hypothetical protein
LRRSPITAVMAQNDRQKLRRAGRFASPDRPCAPLLHGVDIAFQKIVQECADRSDGGETRHFVPARRDRRFQNVGGESESESGDQPAAEALPNVALLVAAGRRKHCPQALQKGFDGADDNHDQRQRVDDGDGIIRGEDQPFS